MEILNVGTVSIANLLTLAFFIEAIISAVKPLWNADGQKLSVTEYVSMALGIVLALVLRLDMIGPVTGLEGDPVAAVIFRTMTGIAMGRGPSFLFDAWKRIKEKDLGITVLGTEEEAKLNEYDPDEYLKRELQE